MKNTILTTALLFLISGISWGQGMEDFSLAIDANEISSSYSNGSFVGNDGITWSYTAARNEGAYPINGNGIMLRKASESGSISATFSGGIGNFSVNTRKAYTGTGKRLLELVVNGNTIQQFEPAFASSGADATVIPFTVNDINISGEVTIILRIPGTTGTDRQITLDDIEWTGFLPSSNPTKLAITSINPSTPSTGNSFDVTVQAQDASGAPANVAGGASISLTRDGGSGVLGGSLTGTIADGTNEVTISGITYDTAESGVSITATDDASILTAATSSTFDVLAAADELVLEQVPTSGFKDAAVASFTVKAQRSGDSSTDLNYTKDITISKVTGTGAMSGTLTKAAVAGVATFDDVTFDTDGSYTIEATDGTVTSAASSGITISTLNELFLLENFNNASLTSSYNNGSFVGNNGITWTYVNSRNENSDANNSGIAGNAIMLQNNTDAKITSASVPNGIGNFSVKLYKGFTGPGNRQVELFVNGVSKGTSTPFDDFNEHIFSIDGLNITGNVVIELRNVTSNQVIVDDIYWTSIDDRFKLSINGNEGWRMLSTPTSDDKYSDLLSNVWTQGFTGANYESGSPNVQTFDTGTNSFGAISNLTDAMAPGQGFITYIYSDDDYTNSEANTGFPKTLSVSGTLNTAPVSANINTAAEKWSLVGNPFNSTIIWGNDLVRTDLTGVVYVYDHSYTTVVGDDAADTSSAGGNYRVWNGTTGSLTDGKIAAFQGFWVQSVAELAGTPALQFTEASKSTGGTFYKQSTQSASFRMIAQMDGFANDAYFSFTNEGKIGKDNYDGLKLAPLDYANYLSFGTEVDGVLMDINNLPIGLNKQVEFPVEINSFKKIDDGYALKGGEVTLSLADLKNIPANWGIVFNNYNTGETIDLRAQDSYTFEIAAKEKMVKAKTAFSVLSPAGITREKSMGASGFSITIQPEKTPVTLEPKDEPKIFALEQNYPNPFNPTTTIKYSVADVGHVNLAVFNIMGQKVAELVNSSKQAGNYAVSWQAQDMASGLYFYRLSAAGQTITRQMTLIK